MLKIIWIIKFDGLQEPWLDLSRYWKIDSMKEAIKRIFAEELEIFGNNIELGMFQPKKEERILATTRSIQLECLKVEHSRVYELCLCNQNIQ